MAAYRRVDGFKSPAGWLPVHRDQLRAQCSITSMGELYLFYSLRVAVSKCVNSVLYLYHLTMSAKAVCPPHSFVCSFIQTDIVTTICHDWLEQSRLSFQGIFIYKPILMTWLDSGGQRSKVKVTAGCWGGEGIDVNACWSPSSTLHLLFIKLQFHSY